MSDSKKLRQTTPYDAFNHVDQLVSKPVLGSDGAASWQNFRQEVNTYQSQPANSRAPHAPVKKADRLGTGFTSRREELENEASIRKASGEAPVGAGYTEFKRKHNGEEAAERKRQKLVEQRIRPKEKKYFIPSKTFEGWKFDYIFTTRQDRGTGYYWDGMDSWKKLKGIALPEQQQQQQPSSADEKGTSSAAKANLSGKTIMKGDSEGEGEEDAKKTKKKKKKKKDKLEGPKMVDDPNHPLNQVAAAIERRRRQQQISPNATPLGGEWEEAKDPTSGKVYYFNRKTGVRQWDAPTSSKTVSGDTLLAGWKSARDAATGKEYYFNEKGETRWDKPVG